MIFAYTLNRERQMQVRPAERQAIEKRASFWAFERLATVRRRLSQQVGRLKWPQGPLTLTLSTNPGVKEEFLSYLGHLRIVS